jgi:DNA invertase Pin-like site-specific DNA recombinase
MRHFGGAVVSSYRKSFVIRYEPYPAAMPKPKRVALYARVSTHERTGDRPGQEPETQRRQLREYAERRAFEVVGEHADVGSGRSEDRPEHQRLLADARSRRLDVVLVWRYDRFARSTQALIGGLKEFLALGVDFISYQENVDTTTPPGEMVYWFLASIA